MAKHVTTEEIATRIKNTFKQNVSLVGEYKNKRSKLTLHCNDCGHEWESPSSSVIYGDRHECPRCGRHAKQLNEFQCTNCGQVVYRKDSDIKKNQTGNFFCSQQCGNEFKNRIRKESGEWDNSLSYRRKAFETYEHLCCVCGWNEDERILEVHHKDEDRTNNMVNNLCILCPTCHRKITLGYYELTDDFKLVDKNQKN